MIGDVILGVTFEKGLSVLRKQTRFCLCGWLQMGPSATETCLFTKMS